MDQVKNTPPPKAKKSKKLIIVVLAILLAAAVVGSYFWRNRDTGEEKPKDNDTSQSSPTPDAITGQIDEIKARYEKTKEDLKTVESKDQVQQMILYSGAAIDGAQLNDPQAKEYATKALALMPESQRSKAPNQQIADFISRLTEISKGNYQPAQEFLDQVEDQ